MSTSGNTSVLKAPQELQGKLDRPTAEGRGRSTKVGQNGHTQAAFAQLLGKAAQADVTQGRATIATDVSDEGAVAREGGGRPSDHHSSQTPPAAAAQPPATSNSPAAAGGASRTPDLRGPQRPAATTGPAPHVSDGEGMTRLATTTAANGNRTAASAATAVAATAMAAVPARAEHTQETTNLAADKKDLASGPTAATAPTQTTAANLVATGTEPATSPAHGGSRGRETLAAATPQAVTAIGRAYGQSPSNKVTPFSDGATGAGRAESVPAQVSPPQLFGAKQSGTAAIRPQAYEVPRYAQSSELKRPAPSATIEPTIATRSQTKPAAPPPLAMAPNASAKTGPAAGRRANGVGNEGSVHDRGQPSKNGREQTSQPSPGAAFAAAGAAEVLQPNAELSQPPASTESPTEDPGLPAEPHVHVGSDAVAPRMEDAGRAGAVLQVQAYLPSKAKQPSTAESTRPRPAAIAAPDGAHAPSSMRPSSANEALGKPAGDTQPVTARATTASAVPVILAKASGVADAASVSAPAILLRQPSPHGVVTRPAPAPSSQAASPPSPRHDDGAPASPAVSKSASSNVAPATPLPSPAAALPNTAPSQGRTTAHAVRTAESGPDRASAGGMARPLRRDAQPRPEPSPTKGTAPKDVDAAASRSRTAGAQPSDFAPVARGQSAQAAPTRSPSAPPHRVPTPSLTSDHSAQARPDVVPAPPQRQHPLEQPSLPSGQDTAKSVSASKTASKQVPNLPSAARAERESPAATLVEPEARVHREKNVKDNPLASAGKPSSSPLQPAPTPSHDAQAATEASRTTAVAAKQPAISESTDGDVVRPARARARRSAAASQTQAEAGAPGETADPNNPTRQSSPAQSPSPASPVRWQQPVADAVAVPRGPASSELPAASAAQTPLASPAHPANSPVTVTPALPVPSHAFPLPQPPAGTAPDFGASAVYQAPPVSRDSSPLYERAADDPGLAVTVLPHAAHLSLTSDGGDLSLHVRVRDGNADVNVSGTMAPMFDSKAPEVRTALATHGLGLGSFATDQQGHGQHSQQRPEPWAAAPPSQPSTPVRRPVAGADDVGGVAADEGRIHITA